jgi:hypothetical protein
MIKELGKFKALIGVVVFIFIGGVAFAGWVKLPKKVTDNTASINKIADTVDKYIIRQETLEESRNRREELMLELIRQKKDK